MPAATDHSPDSRSFYTAISRFDSARIRSQQRFLMLTRWNVNFQTAFRLMPCAAESALAYRVDFGAGREETERCRPLGSREPRPAVSAL